MLGAGPRAWRHRHVRPPRTNKQYNSYDTCTACPDKSLQYMLYNMRSAHQHSPMILCGVTVHICMHSQKHIYYIVGPYFITWSAYNTIIIYEITLHMTNTFLLTYSLVFKLTYYNKTRFHRHTLHTQHTARSVGGHRSTEQRCQLIHSDSKYKKTLHWPYPRQYSRNTIEIYIIYITIFSSTFPRHNTKV